MGSQEPVQAACWLWVLPMVHVCLQWLLLPGVGLSAATGPCPPPPVFVGCGLLAMGVGLMV